MPRTLARSQTGKVAALLRRTRDCGRRHEIVERADHRPRQEPARDVPRTNGIHTASLRIGARRRQIAAPHGSTRANEMFASGCQSRTFVGGCDFCITSSQIGTATPPPVILSPIGIECVAPDPHRAQEVRREPVEPDDPCSSPTFRSCACHRAAEPFRPLRGAALHDALHQVDHHVVDLGRDDLRRPIACLRRSDHDGASRVGDEIVEPRASHRQCRSRCRHNRWRPRAA